VAELFLEEYPHLLSEIEQSIEQSNNEALTRAAHTLKGSAANMAAKSVAEVSLELEKIGRDGDMTHAKERYVALKEEIERLRPVLVGLGKVRSHV